MVTTTRDDYSNRDYTQGDYPTFNDIEYQAEMETYLKRKASFNQFFVLSRRMDNPWNTILIDSNSVFFLKPNMRLK